MPYDLDILASTQFDFCVRCYAEEGTYAESPCHLIVDGEAQDFNAMKLPHHGRKAISSDT